MPTQLSPYLSYDGNCADAMRFYAELFGAKLEALITFGQMPQEMPCPPGGEHRVMHAHLVHPGFSLMAGDTPPGMAYQGIQGAMMAISFDEPAEAQRVFAALSQGGTVTMPLAETFWAQTFGMVTDRFGTPWGINGGPKAMPAAPAQG
ncbi:VOC family protein [Hydrogenophaga sp. T2]|uniref:VOC family protein n=1 Tax=Hydrogenophaga sp. T2 TaxID=3132823 RepID=UPI003CF7DBB0